MFKSLTLLTAIAAIAGSAHAEGRVFRASVAVPLAGKSAAQIASDIRRAAREACEQAALQAGAYRVTSDAECRASAIRAAERVVKDHVAAIPPSRVALAN